MTALDLAPPGSVHSVTPLTGGVASDIALVSFADRQLVAKFALEKLRVAQEWRAPVARNAVEYAWLQFAGKALPGSAPRLFGRDDENHGFAMEYLAGGEARLWKTELLAGRIHTEDAQRTGDSLGRLHAVSTLSSLKDPIFDNQDLFFDLRLEPYLAFLQRSNPSLTRPLAALIKSQQQHLKVVIHGDVSPKNILIRSSQPIFLDAECATRGDPAFDVGFCTNHLLLKAFHMPEHIAALIQSARYFWSHYQQHVCWESVEDLEQRVCAVLPALLLARVEGKSPVEYLDDPTRNRVRAFALPLISSPSKTFDVMLDQVATRVHGVFE